MRLALRASAKINLDLRVGARRLDGYHDLSTVLQTLDLHDTVTLESRRGPLTLDGDPSLMPLDQSNLVWRAAEALWQAAGKAGAARGVRIRVVKRIPAQAGLGGGSSDAAAALVGLSNLWRLRLPLADLMAIAATLGSDVPFFLIGGTALGLGRGERVLPLANRPRRHVVLALPDFGVSTADAYRWLAGDRTADPGLRTADSGRRTPDAELLAQTPRGWVNDLEPPVERRHPAIAAIRGQLTKAGAEVARMSGSGSAVFGLFLSDRAARRAAAGLIRGGHRVVVTRTRRRNLVESRRLG